MNKEFIPYEPSLALKELGFDEPCFGYYKPKGELDYIENHILKDFPYLAKNSEWQDLCGAATYSQAFRWFREKHKLYHTINMFGDWDKPQYSYLVSGRTMNNPAHMWHFEDKDSHEEAELACLIKLIEIVKQNSN